MNPFITQRIEWMLNLFENDSGKKETDYKTVYRYHDGNGKRRQVTLGRGFTEDGGNLRRVVDAYLAAGGQSEALRAKVGQIGKGVLAGDAEFVKALVNAADEQSMKDAQDTVFLEEYLGPAYQWASSNGFNEPLSFAVAADSYLHSGQMTPFLVKSFPEHTPANGGREKVWMQEYCEARLAWFTRVSGDLHTCMFRPNFLLAQMKANNWQFECPMRIAEKGQIC